MAIRQADVIARLKAGETLILTLPKGDCASEKAQAYLSGGGNVTGATYRKLTDPAASLLRPVSPGLFSDVEPQEWGWADV